MGKHSGQNSFQGTSTYVVDPELAKIVNISIALELPLLLKGEPGTGKTLLAHALAESLGKGGQGQAQGQGQGKTQHGVRSFARIWVTI